MTGKDFRRRGGAHGRRRTRPERMWKLLLHQLLVMCCQGQDLVRISRLRIGVRRVGGDCRGRGVLLWLRVLLWLLDHAGISGVTVRPCVPRRLDVCCCWFRRNTESERCWRVFLDGLLGMHGIHRGRVEECPEAVVLHRGNRESRDETLLGAHHAHRERRRGLTTRFIRHRAGGHWMRRKGVGGHRLRDRIQACGRWSVHDLGRVEGEGVGPVGILHRGKLLHPADGGQLKYGRDDSRGLRISRCELLLLHW